MFTDTQKASARDMLRIAKSRSLLDVNRQIDFALSRTQAATKLSKDDTLALLREVAGELPAEPALDTANRKETRRMSEIYGG